MSKAEQIRSLFHLPNAVIAKRVGCRDTYVRAVRQRTSSNGFPVRAIADLNYYSVRLEKQRERYRTDPKMRETKAKQQRSWRKRVREAARLQAP